MHATSVVRPVQISHPGSAKRTPSTGYSSAFDEGLKGSAGLSRGMLKREERRCSP